MGMKRIAHAAAAAVMTIAGVSAGVIGVPEAAGAATVEQNGPLNYAGPNCPGAGWNCTTQTTDVVQRTTGAGGQNVLDAPSGAACQVTQIASGGSNTATCSLSSSAGGASLSADVAQTNTTGANTATVTLTISGQAGTTQIASQQVDVDQDNVDGNNDATVTQSVTQSSSIILNAPVVQSQVAEVDAAVDQSATGTGSNTLDTTQGLTQTQQANGTTVTQTQRLPATGPASEPDVDAVLVQRSNSGNNLATLDQDITRTQAATSALGSTQTQGTEVGGTRGLIDPDAATGTSHYDADQSKDWSQDVTGLAAATQEQYDPQDCCIILGGLYTPDTCTITQTTQLDQDTQGVQEAHSHAQGVAHDTCTANQTATIDGQTHTNSASGPVVDTETNCDPQCTSKNNPVSRVGAEIQNGLSPGYGTSASAAPGETVDYRFTYTNDGVVSGTGTTVATSVPAGTHYVDCDPGCSVVGSSITWSLGTVAPGASVPVVLTVQVDAGATPASVTTTAAGDTTEEDEEPVPSNEVTLTITGASPTGALREAVRNETGGQVFTGPGTPSSTDAQPGDVIEYQLTFHGGAPSEFVRYSAAIPEGTTFLSCNRCAGDKPWNDGAVRFYRGTITWGGGGGDDDDDDDEGGGGSWNFGSAPVTFRVQVNAETAGDVDHSSTLKRYQPTRYVPSNRTTVRVS